MCRIPLLEDDGGAMTFLACLWLILVITLIAHPIFSYQRSLVRSELVQSYRHFQKDLIRARYPRLRELTDSELEALFDIDDLYQEL